MKECLNQLLLHTILKKNLLHPSPTLWNLDPGDWAAGFQMALVWRTGEAAVSIGSVVCSSHWSLFLFSSSFYLRMWYTKISPCHAWWNARQRRLRTGLSRYSQHTHAFASHHPFFNATPLAPHFLCCESMVAYIGARVKAIMNVIQSY